MVGEARKLALPEPKQVRSSSERLCGLRYIHTHLDDEPLGQEDLAELALSRLDCVAAINVDSHGFPRTVQLANLAFKGGGDKPWQVWEPLSVTALSRHPFAETLRAIEKELSRGPSAGARSRPPSEGQKVLLVGVCTGSLAEAEESMKELQRLAISSGAVVVESVLQRRPAVHPQFVVGAGKIQELAIQAFQAGADTIVFDRNLTAAQVRHVTDLTDLKILDRTQLILHIFAQRAKTRDGKLQVELAQLRYRLPRLVHRNTGLSRLAGGIGGLGPGETKLEIDRRRVRERIHRLEKEIERLRKERGIRRAQRAKSGLPLACIVGYTNAGKSTLLNSLTRSRVYTADRMFATLDPCTRRLRLSPSRGVLITDTVGFIRDLPPDLIAAFRATLEELHEAHILLHVIDGSSPSCEKQIRAVENLLEELELGSVPRISVFNKADIADSGQLTHLCRRYDGLAVSALDPSTLPPLLERMTEALQEPVFVRRTGETLRVAEGSPEYSGQSPENSLKIFKAGQRP